MWGWSMIKFLMSLVLGLMAMTSVIASNVNASDSAKGKVSDVKDAGTLKSLVPMGGLSLEEERKKVSEGKSNDLYLLAGKYLEGNGVEQSDKKAFLLFEQAANQGNVSSMIILGVLYYEHQDPKDLVRYNIGEISDIEAAQRSFFWFK